MWAVGGARSTGSLTRLSLSLDETTLAREGMGRQRYVPTPDKPPRESNPPWSPVPLGSSCTGFPQVAGFRDAICWKSWHLHNRTIICS